MGINLQKPVILSSDLRAQDYEVVQDRPSVQQHLVIGGRILRNKLTGIELQQYNLQLTNLKQFEECCNFYHWRLSQDHVNTREMCSTTYFARLFTQRIPIKLVEIVDIPYPDNLYVMLSTLDGFSKIVERTGYFDVHQNMIGINKQGEVKVWLNDDLSKNLPQLGFSKRYQNVMVQKIIQMIDNNTDQSSQPDSLKNFILRNLKTQTFSEAMILVRQFSKIHKTEIPSTFQSILELINNPNCLNQIDFDISQSNYFFHDQALKQSSLPTYLLKNSQSSMISKIGNSPILANKSNKNSGIIKSNTHNMMLMNNSRGISGVYKSMLHPSAVVKAVPLTRIGNPSPLNSRMYNHKINQQNAIPNQFSQQSSICQSKYLDNKIPHPLSHHPLELTKTCPLDLKSSYNQNMITRQSILVRQNNSKISMESRQSEIRPSSTIPQKKTSQQIVNKPQPHIRFLDINDSSIDEMSFQRLKQDRSQSQSQSAYYQKQVVRQPPKRGVCSPLVNQQNIKPFSQLPILKSKNNININYYSSKDVHIMDPDIARDLMALEDD